MFFPFLSKNSFLFSASGVILLRYFCVFEAKIERTQCIVLEIPFKEKHTISNLFSQASSLFFLQPAFKRGQSLPAQLLVLPTILGQMIHELTTNSSKKVLQPILHFS